MHWLKNLREYGFPHEDTTDGHLSPSEPELEPDNGSGSPPSFVSRVADTSPLLSAAAFLSVTALATGVLIDGRIMVAWFAGCTGCKVCLFVVDGVILY